MIDQCISSEPRKISLAIICTTQLLRHRHSILLKFGVSPISLGCLIQSISTLVHFQVLGHQSFSDFNPDADTIDPESLDPPRTNEQGWNDTVTVDPGEVAHIIVHFGEYDGLFNDQTGHYMWHCHMLEHEDHDMMRPMEVLPDDSGNNEEKCEWPVDDENRDSGGPIFE